MPNCRHRKLATISFLHNIHTMNRPYIISFCILIFTQDNGYEWYSWYWSRVAVKSQGKVLSLVPSLERSCSNRAKVKREIVFSTAKQRSWDAYQTKVRRCIVICAVKQSTNSDTSLMVTSSLCSLVHRNESSDHFDSLWHTYLYTMASDQQPTSYRHKDTRNKMHIKRTTLQ